jgi:cytochrome c-type biogenesis protein CcmH/NrfG
MKGLEKLNKTNRTELQYRKAIEKNPQDSKAWLQLGLLTTDKIEAEKDFRQAIKYDPNNSAAWFNLGKL